MSKYTKHETSSSFPLSNQVRVANKSSNVDFNYGPYDLPEGMYIDEIIKGTTGPNILDLDEDTLQTIAPGKTFGFIGTNTPVVGVTSSEQVIELWAQLVPGLTWKEGEPSPNITRVESGVTYANYVLEVKGSKGGSVDRITNAQIDNLFS